jgi:hypothetical protein
MNHVMVDLETLGTLPGCAIMSVGAVFFDTSGLGDEFYMVAQQDSCIQAGLTIDADTASWWAQRSPAARRVLTESLQKRWHTLQHVLAKFTEFVERDAEVKVWGNGADFDNPILACAFAAVELKQAWGRWNGRCYRTLRSIAPGPKLLRVGTHHNALDDAKSQALHAIELFKLHPSLVLR